uniref:Uncharacterized protein n=1 Tax=Phasianus colchicus TaxID=9054 RepID=A0A669Q4D2_PHACC
MDAEALDELAGQLQGEALGGRGLLQLAATTGLAAYAVWAAVLMPGFRRVPLHLQVPPKCPASGQCDGTAARPHGEDGGSGFWGRPTRKGGKRGGSPGEGGNLKGIPSAEIPRATVLHPTSPH